MGFGNFEEYVDLIPEGKCRVLVHKAEVVTGSKADPSSKSEGLKLTLSITEGQFEKQMVFATIYYKNKLGNLIGMGNRSLDELAKSVGLGGIKDFDKFEEGGKDQLMGKQFLVNLKITDDEYGRKSEVLNWYVKGAAPVAAKSKSADTEEEGEVPF